MRDGFVSLAELVRRSGERSPVERALDAAPALLAPLDFIPTARSVSEESLPPEPAGCEALLELALMRAAAAEAYERCIPRLLASLASDVLGRELALAPADVGVLVERALAAFREHEPVAVGFSTVDAGRFDVSLPVRAAPELAAGDFVVHVRDGSFESYFRLRLEHAVDVAHEAGAVTS